MTDKITPKGTHLPLMDIKGKPYLQVAWRIVWFREEHADWTIQTSFTEINTEKRYAIAEAIIMDETGRTIATAHKVETSTGFADYLEKAETGAIGRALALCGYGTQFEPEFDEGTRIADSPISSHPAPLEQAQEVFEVDETPTYSDITILSIEEKESAKGTRYLRVATNSGNATVFDSKLFDKIQVGSARVVLEKKGNFTSIVNVL